jgi:hypothetical protein
MAFTLLSKHGTDSGAALYHPSLREVIQITQKQVLSAAL